MTETTREVVYKRQPFRRLGTEPYVRADGTETRIAVWESRCPVCGVPFQFTSTRTTMLRWPTRRCPEHRGGAWCYRGADRGCGGLRCVHSQRANAERASDKSALPASGAGAHERDAARQSRGRG